MIGRCDYAVVAEVLPLGKSKKQQVTLAKFFFEDEAAAYRAKCNLTSFSTRGQQYDVLKVRVTRNGRVVR